MKRQLIYLVVLMLTVVGCTDVVAKLESEKNVPELITLLEKDKYLADNAAEALGNIGDKQAVKPLITALKSSKDALTRLKAAEALGKMGDSQAVQPLIDTLPDAEVKEAALNALKKIAAQNPQVVKILIPAFKKGDANAKEALMRIGAPAVDSLIAALKDQKTRVDAAHYQIARGETQELQLNWEITKKVLLKDVTSNNYQTILYGIYSFIALGNQDSITTLVQTLKQKGHEGKTMALAYLNCGEPTLEKAAEEWAAANGYQVVKTPNKNTSAPTWGEGL